MSALLAGPTTDTRTLDSIVFGPITIPMSAVFTFADGLHGFEEHREFALVPGARDGLYWMQSTTVREIAFLLVDPFLVVPGYEVDLGASERTALDVEDAADVLVFAIVTLPGTEQGTPTANLRGPIVFNAKRRIARQVLSAAQDRDLHTPVDLHALAPRLV